MKKPQRPFAARIAFDDKARLTIAEALDRRSDIDLSSVSRQVLNRNHAYLFQYLFKNTPRILDYVDAVKLAHFLKIDASVFLPGLPAPSRLAENSALSGTSPAASESDTVPIFTEAEGKKDVLDINGNIIGNASRHPGQKGMAGGFAFYAAGEAMAPRYRAGEIVYAVINKPPTQGQDCVIELHNGDAYLYEFTRRTAREVVTRQWNPAKERKFSAAEVKALHAVVGRG